MARHLAACFLLVSTAIAAAQAKHFGPDDLPKIVRVSDPRLSPDGKTIAYVVGRANLKDDRWDSEIDFVDIASKQTRAMTHERMGAGAPRWSPSGERLAFIAADADKKAQVFIMPLTGGGDAVQVTHSKTGATGFAWRPDGAAIAYAAADEEPEKKDEAKFEDAFEVGNNDMLERSHMMPVHLWMVKLGAGNVADGAAKRLTSGAWSIPNHLPGGGAAIVFSKDGGTIVFLKAETSLTGDTDTTRLMRLNVATGEITPMTKSAAVEDNPLLSPDGNSVAYTSTRGGLRAHEEAIFVAPLAGGPGKEVSTALDRSIGNAAWLPDGKTMVVGATDHTKAALWLLPVGGAARKIDVGGLNPAGFNVGLDGALAFTATSTDRPAELFYAAKPGATPMQMTHLQTVTDGLTLGKQETVHWSVEKFQESGVLTYPPEYVAGRKYPMVLYIHGGPTAASVETFTPSSQILAAHGWLVFEPNYRGSNSDGDAYETAIIKDAGVGPGHDVMAGVTMLEARGIVDEKRIAVSGWSYGGYMTSWLIGNYPSVWKAAVAGAPVTDMVDIYTLSDVTSYAIDIFGPSPFVGDNLKLYVAESPITYASKMRTPTLIMCDVGDYRVPIPMAYKLYHALKDNGAPVKFVAFPVSGHSPADPIRARDVWRRWVAWLGPYLDDPAK